MEFLHARAQLSSALDAVVSAAELSFSDQARSPCRFLRCFLDEIKDVPVPILLKSRAIAKKENVRGLKSHPKITPSLQDLLDTCWITIDKIETDLSIDFCKQLEFLDVTPEKTLAVEEPLPSLIEETVKAIINLLTDENPYLNPKYFSAVNEIISWSDRFSTQDEWQSACDEFMSKLSIGESTQVFVWNDDNQLVVQNWSEILELQHGDELFNDEHVMPIDASWLLFFWHENVLTYGQVARFK